MKIDSDIEAKNKAVRDYCKNSEFRTFTDDPKATIYNLRAMAFASGWEACMFHFDLITRMPDDNQIPVVHGGFLVEPPITIPQDPNMSEIDKKAEAYSSKECDQIIKDGLSHIEMDLVDYRDTVKEIYKAGYQEALKDKELEVNPDFNAYEKSEKEKGEGDEQR